MRWPGRGRGRGRRTLGRPRRRSEQGPGAAQRLAGHLEHTPNTSLSGTTTQGRGRAQKRRKRARRDCDCTSLDDPWGYLFKPYLKPPPGSFFLDDLWYLCVFFVEEVMVRADFLHQARIFSDEFLFLRDLRS
ncbi:Hypothetical predicted protein [Marmota monax]|uniref:Uncharacterized protein n=1 Tax=Marmota monax TaxID=9995 RepID=A0A5E4BMV2_MARMO|nr:Hypothetical predicted protein [Marmota monax]